MSRGPDRRRPWWLAALLMICVSLTAAEGEALPTVEQATAGLRSHTGLLTFYTDPARGKVWLELPATSDPRGEIGRYLYVEGLVAGLGSNPVGLDRGLLGEARVVALRNLGGKLLVEQINLGYRASGDALQRRAVAESFATSVLWAGEWAARSADGRTLVDFTTFVVRDAHGSAETLEQAGQGPWRLDDRRSAADLDNCLAFPKNLEFEALVTFAGDEPGAEVRQVAPDPRSVTLVQHQSLLSLPLAGYATRAFDPRAGSDAVFHKDYSAPLDEPIERGFIVRHRLEKIHPEQPVSRVKQPIVYYVDPATPEPVRSALIDGASWWAEAFAAAGFVDAFRVELLPVDASPLDARYNVIEWVHRSTRGWSYGGGVIDPRTGEAVKGHVRLGSLRVRQDRLLFESLLGTENTGRGGPNDPVQLALARVRQLAAHEVGHSLGLMHNFAASTYGRASVMDYPAPRIRVGDDGRLDVSQAYTVGVGAWDLHAIRYAYATFAAGANESAELERIVEEGIAEGLVFLSDRDARPAGAAQPLASLWDNGADPLDELEEVMEVRRVGLRSFGPHNVRPGTPLARLEERLATLYLYHRYQVAAAAKLIGGLDYAYAVRGDGQAAARPIDAARQRRAIDRLLAALAPSELDLSDDTLSLLLPLPEGYDPGAERFGGDTAPAFDALGAAATAAALVVGELLQPERCARMIDFHRRDSELPGFAELLDRLISNQFTELPAPPERERAIRERVRQVVVSALMELASNEAAAPEVRVEAEATLAALKLRLEGRSATEARIAAGIARFLDRPYAVRRPGPAAVAPPPGSPIGGFAAPAGGCSRDEGLPGG